VADENRWMSRIAGETDGGGLHGNTIHSVNSNSKKCGSSTIANGGEWRGSARLTEQYQSVSRTAANVHGAALSAVGVTGRQTLQSFAAAGWAVVLVGGVGLHCAGQTLLTRWAGVCGGRYHAENRASTLHVYVQNKLEARKETRSRRRGERLCAAAKWLES
jgi:hypothetical protein